MRILLINPFYPISETPSPPLGLAYLAAALENAGHTVTVYDCVVKPYTIETLAAVMADFRPDMAGVTAVTMNVDRAMAVVADVKATDPEVVTVAGGPHVTFCSEQTLKDHPALDIIVTGEGEATLVSLAATVGSGRKWDRVAGLVFRRGKDITDTGSRPFMADINALRPPARHLLPLGRYRTLHLPVSMITSRGCPFQCIFCVGRKMVGARVRYRNPAAVVDEMADLANLGFPQVNIADDLFTAKPGHCIAVCDEILQRGLSVQWTSFARVDTVSLKVLKKMKAAGCTGVSFGVETGNPGILKTIRKGIVLDQVTDAVRMCTDAGVTPYASFILGLPRETPDTLKETLNFADRLEKMGVSYGFHLLAPFPGTEIRKNHPAYGIRILTDDWTRYHANRAIVETDAVTADMLDDIAIRWEERYDAYLGDIARRMKEGTISDAEAWPLVNLERTVLVYDLMMGSVIEAIGNQGDPEGRQPETEALGKLSEKTAIKIGQPKDKVHEALKWAVERKGLECHRQNGRIKWQWVDGIENSGPEDQALDCH